MRLTMFFAGVIFYSSALFGQNLRAQESNKKFNDQFKVQSEQMDHLLSSWNNAVPGIALAVIKEGDILYKNCLGLADLENDRSISSKSTFNLGSLSQVFTAYALLLLEQQGKLSLDDEVQLYIPELPKYDKAVSLRHLATHSHGLRDYHTLMQLRGWNKIDAVGTQDALELISNQKELNFNPGEKYQFSGTGYVLLAEVISKVSRMSFSEFCQEHFFQPLKMLNTTVFDHKNMLVKNRADSYFVNSGAHNKINVNNEIVGDGNVYSSLDDLMLWAKELSNPTILDRRILERMNSPLVLNNGDTTRVGLGHDVSSYKGLVEYSLGSTIQAGFFARTLQFPEENLSIIVLTNSPLKINYITFMHNIADIFLKEKLGTDPLQEANQGHRSKFTEMTYSNEQICGLYRHESGRRGVEIKIHEVGDKLGLRMDFINVDCQVGNNVRNRYEIIENPRVKIEFDSLKNGQAQILRKYENGSVSIWKRVAKEQPILEDLQRFEGKFHSEELSVDFTFTIVNGKLTLKHDKLGPITFQQTGKGNFQGSNWLLNQIEYIIDDGNVSGMRISNHSVRDLYLSKRE